MADQGEARSNPLPALPIAITLAVCAAYVGLQWIPLPGQRAEPLTFATLGMKPILGAFILVELVAAAVPGLRPLRSSAEGRTRLRRTALGVAVLLALLQTYGVLRYARAAHLFAEPSVLYRPLIEPWAAFSGALFLGVIAVMALARLIDVAGVGVGYSLLIAAGIVASAAQSVAEALRQSAPLDLLSLFLLLGAFLTAAWRMLATAPRAGSRARYRLPTSGLEPVHQGVLIAAIVLGTDTARAFFWPLVPKVLEPLWVMRALQLLFTITLCGVFSRVFHRPATDEDRSALARTTLASMLWLAGLTAGSWFVEGAFTAAGVPGVDALLLVALVAVGMDLARELRAVVRSGRQRALRVVHRLEDADALSAALGTAGIDSALRGAHHRALYQFFAPFIPVGVLVAEADAERAEVVAAEHERAI